MVQFFSNNALTEPITCPLAVGQGIYITSGMLNSSPDPFSLISTIMDLVLFLLQVITSQNLSPAHENRLVPNNNVRI